MLKRHCFKMYSSIPYYSNTVRVHALQTLFSYFSLQFQIVSNIIRMHVLQTLFKKSAFPNLFKYHPNTCLRAIVFPKKSAVPKRFKKCQNAFFRDIVLIFSLQFQIVSNTFSMHTLETLPRVAIHHILLIINFGNCVLL